MNFLKKRAKRASEKSEPSIEVACPQYLLSTEEDEFVNFDLGGNVLESAITCLKIKAS